MDDINTNEIEDGIEVEATSEPEPQAHPNFPQPERTNVTFTGDTLKDLGKMLGDLLEDTAKEMGRDLKGDLDSVRAFSAQRMAHLAGAIAEPGFQEALKAEKDAIILRAAGQAVKNADAVDQRLHSIVETALLIGSRALMGLPAA